MDGEEEKYPYYIFFILGNEFCERYAYYGMRSILVIFLSYFLGYDKDTSTVIYHTFAALCYFFPLLGGILADSYLGKFRTILYVSILYFFGMVMMSLSAVPQLNGGQSKPGTINEILAITALIIIAMGTGGIKPCVSALGGDQFSDTPKGKERLSAFFSLFYASINAGSLLSTFISPILRETECFERSDCYFIAFIVPACLMLVAIVAFFLGRNYYIVKKPSGNVFARFCKATWNGLRNRCKAKEKKEHFIDHCDPVLYPPSFVKDFKYVYPVIVMYLPIPFYRALAEMQGSRFVLTATQMDGWMGTAIKIKPDQMQILNPIMILAFLPMFQYGVYPLLEKCGLRMTALRRMSAGQLFTALAFVVAGFVQMEIDKGLTPIPDYGSQNSLMVINGHGIGHDNALSVKSEYWNNTEPTNGLEKKTSFLLQDNKWRTETFDWIADELPAGDTIITIGGEPQELYDYPIAKEKITAILCYNNGADVCESYYSPIEKSGSIRVRAVLLNPTNYCANFRLVEFGDTGETFLTNDTIVQPYKNAINDGTEFERGVYKIVTRLMPKKDDECPNSVLEDDPNVIKCETEFIANEGHDDYSNPESFAFAAGSIWTWMVTARGDGTCTVQYDKDSNGNNVNIFLLFPQYFVITVGEVMNSVTGLEFSYTQAPKSMKSVVQSFWLLTTCIGNIIDVFFVEIKLHPTQAGEYFILSLIMVGATGIFVLLSIFYYEYVPEGTFSEEPELDEIENTDEKAGDDGIVNKAMEDDEIAL